MTAAVDELTTVPEPQPEPEPEPDEPQPEPQPEPEPDGRCEAETTVGGVLYRCALQAEHRNDHSFQPAAEDDGDEGMSEKEHSRRLQALEKEALRHANRIREIIGADADELHMCELCAPNLAGWRFDAVPDPEITKAVRIAIGLPDVSNFRSSHTEAVCDNCAGLGKVRTGSLVPGHETARCDSCGGKGYVPTRQRQHGELGELPDDETDLPTPIAAGDDVQRDMFGTPIGDPDYGLMPALRKRPVEYWLNQLNP